MDTIKEKVALMVDYGDCCFLEKLIEDMYIRVVQHNPLMRSVIGETRCRALINDIREMAGRIRDCKKSLNADYE